MLILGHALSSCARCPPCKMNSIFHDNHRRVLRTIIPVSKDWYWPVATLLYRSPVLHSREGLIRLARTLGERPQLSRLVSSLDLAVGTRGSRWALSLFPKAPVKWMKLLHRSRQGKYDQKMHALLGALPSLTSITLGCETHNSLELDHILGPAPCTTSLTRLVLKCAPGGPKTLPILDILATFSCLRDRCLVGFNGCGALRLPKLPSLRILRVWSCYFDEEQVSPTLGGLALETLEFFDTPTELIGMVCAYLHRGDSRVSPRKELDMGVAGRGPRRLDTPLSRASPCLFASVRGVTMRSTTSEAWKPSRPWKRLSSNGRDVGMKPTRPTRRKRNSPRRWWR